MVTRNLPIITLAIFFGILLYLIFTFPRYSPQENIIAPSELAAGESKAFVGRMAMPSLDDIYVLENSAGRDLTKLETYIQGRAAGLHWLSQEHFKQARRAKKKDDVTMGVMLTLDSAGVFRCDEISFSTTDDEDLKTRLAEHIERFWRYTRSTAGTTKIWIPIRWRYKY